MSIVTVRRVVIGLTFVAVVGLGAVLLLSGSSDTNMIGTVVSALAAVAAVGVAVWAGLPTLGESQVRRSGRAVARGRGSEANTGVLGERDENRRGTVEQTGDAWAAGGGKANTGLSHQT